MKAAMLFAVRQRLFSLSFYLFIFWGAGGGGQGQVESFNSMRVF